MYCAEIWGNTYAANLKCLVLLQKRVVRLICGAQRLDHISSLFYDLRILKLPDMVKLKTAEIMYKEYNNSLPNNIHKPFVLYDPTYMTRQKCVFKLKYVRTNLSTMCISINGVKLCNSLDSSVIPTHLPTHFHKHTRTLAGSYTCSFSESRAEVASSRSRILGLRNSALAMAMRCFCPPLNWLPHSPTFVSYPYDYI